LPIPGNFSNSSAEAVLMLIRDPDSLGILGEVELVNTWEGSRVPGPAEL
jgi:hypothetical protein